MMRRRREGSKLDRHEHIGEGTIGAAAFRRLLRDPRFAHAAFIAETPVDAPGDEARNVGGAADAGGGVRFPFHPSPGAKTRWKVSFCRRWIVSFCRRRRFPVDAVVGDGNGERPFSAFMQCGAGGLLFVLGDVGPGDLHLAGTENLEPVVEVGSGSDGLDAEGSRWGIRPVRPRSGMRCGSRPWRRCRQSGIR